MKINKIIIISALFLNYLKAQILTPEIAVETAIKNNINIIISRNNAEIANIAYSRGNAGMLPNLQLNGGGTISQNDTRQNLLNGTVVDRKGANSSLINSSLSLNWTLFDGKKMFFTYKKLGSEKNLAEKEIKKDIEELTANILNKYYTLVKTKLLIKSFDTLMNLYKTRLETAEYKWKNGSSSKLNFLQAQTDMNEQESELIKYKN
ncbi:MAG: TolC family protein, partial [Bacteroidota bacterium]